MATRPTPNPQNVIDPIVAAKAAELRAFFDGREMVTQKMLLALLAISPMTAHRLTKQGVFVRRANLPGYGRVRYTVDDIAEYIVRASASHAPQAPALAPASSSSGTTPKKRGRPRKTRTATR